MSKWLSDEELDGELGDEFRLDELVPVFAQAKEANRLRAGIKELSRDLFDEMGELEWFVNRDGTPASLKPRLGGLLSLDAMFAYRLARLLVEGGE